MIRNYKQLEVTRKQLALAEDALVSLHEGVYAKNPRNYAVFSESYIDMILQLRAQIDAFLHIVPATPEMPAPCDNAPTGGAPVVQDTDAGAIAVAGTPEATS